MARKRKLGILLGGDPSHWQSCNTILANMVSSYKLLGERTSLPMALLSYSLEDERLDLRQGTGYVIRFAQRLLQSEVTDVIFLDHQIDPVPILTALRSLSGHRFRQFRFAFHLYGDFTLQPDRWIQVGKLLKGIKKKFICASHRQQQLVSFFEDKNHSMTAVCPFSVNTNAFAFSKDFRKAYRKKLGITDRQTLLLYTGRLSLQKSVDRLIEEFLLLNPTGANDVSLALAGPVDDFGGLTNGLSLPNGFYFHRLRTRVAVLPKAVRQKILFLGDLGADELARLYSAADVFVSLSLYHDEDFGMSPAEALSSGLPSILTDWGGYASFTGPGIPCQLVPVHIGTRGLTIDLPTLRTTLADQIGTRPTPENRLDAGKAFAACFGIAAVADRLHDQLDVESFTAAAGFHWNLSVVSSSGSIKDELYRDVYGQYVRSPSH